jgi:hypothetical protein
VTGLSVLVGFLVSGQWIGDMHSISLAWRDVKRATGEGEDDPVSFHRLLFCLCHSTSHPATPRQLQLFILIFFVLDHPRTQQVNGYAHSKRGVPAGRWPFSEDRRVGVMQEARCRPTGRSASARVTSTDVSSHLLSAQAQTVLWVSGVSGVSGASGVSAMEQLGEQFPNRLEIC